MVQTVPVDAGVVLGGRYKLAERLGEGGMSVVWRARDEVLARDVAVKLLSTRYLTDFSSRQRIRAEAQAAAKLSHPNIAGVFDYGESEPGVGGAGDERVPYIVMELLTGTTLAEQLEKGPLPVPRVLRVGAEVAAALAAAHEQDIVHRDVKPANVMVTAGGVAKVVDFGVAAVIGDLAEHRSDAVLFGTPAYVAPERLEGGPVVSGTDVYGLGVLLYRMLTGHMPWSAESTTQMLIAHMYVEPEPLPPLSGLPTDVVEICQACLEKDPADRPAAADVATILTAAATALESGSTPKPAGRVRSGPKAAAALRGRRGRRLGVAGAAAAVIVAAVVTAAVARPDTTPPAGSGAVAAQGGDPVVDPEVSAGVGGVPGASNGAASGVPGQPGGPVDPRQAGQPTMTTSVPPAGGNPGSDPTVAPPTTPPPPDPVDGSDNYLGNSVTVRCVGAEATVLAATAADEWVVRREESGPTTGRVRVKYRSSTIEPYTFAFRGWCVNGAPVIERTAD